jgi:uncharacterized membrane protein
MEDKTPRFYEKGTRSLMKSISFRALVIVSDFIVVYLLTRRYDFAVGIIVATNLASTLLYYFHERLWNATHWGKRAADAK